MLKGSKGSTEYKELKHDSKIIRNREQMADIFNNYFVDSVEQLRINVEGSRPGRIIDAYTDKIFERFELIEVGSLKITTRKLCNKSGTEEGITVKIMKLIVEVAGEKIACIFNRSLEEGMFPSE